MPYTTEYDLFADSSNDLHKKVARALTIAAKNVIDEDPGTANHAERLAWANRVRAHPDSTIEEAHRAMIRVLDNTTVSAAGNAATDNDVQFVVSSLVDHLAGV